MAKPNLDAGYFRSGLPYNRYGSGPCPLVVCQGLVFENKPVTGSMARMNSVFKFLEASYSVYIVIRKPHLPAGYSMKDMADDYAAMIGEEFGGPVDVIGISTGGSIVQHLAADHPEAIRRLVIHSSAYKLGNMAKKIQWQVRNLAIQHRWREAYAVMMGFMFSSGERMPLPTRALTWLVSNLMSAFGAPKDPNDLVVTIEAEDVHNFKDRLGEIRAPTLVAGGGKDPFYPPELFRETAGGIPNARLRIYEGVGHPAAGKKFEQDVLAFLCEDRGP